MPISLIKIIGCLASSLRVLNSRLVIAFAILSATSPNQSVLVLLFASGLFSPVGLATKAAEILLYSEVTRCPLAINLFAFDETVIVGEDIPATADGTSPMPALIVFCIFIIFVNQVPAINQP